MGGGRGGGGEGESPLILSVTIFSYLAIPVYCGLGAEKTKVFSKIIKLLIKTYYVTLRPSSTPSVQWAIYRAAFSIFREEDPFQS
jgi:hypothetical protein